MVQQKKKPCVFCDIVAGRADAYRIYEDEQSVCLLDINPFAEGHCLVISKRHEPWWHDLNEKETESLFQVARIVARKMMKAYHPDFVCLYARGRRIPHTHVFLVPSFKGDVLDRFFNALEGVQESPQELARLKGKTSLKDAARKLRGAK
jgi:histidine triad (HIT) family protein